MTTGGRNGANCLSGLDAIALAAQLLRMGTVRVLRFSFPVVLGLRLHLVCTLQGLPAALALTGAKADEREVLLAVFTAEPALITSRPGQALIGDKNYYGRGFETALAQAGLRLLRPARKGDPDPAGSRLFRPLRQVIWHNDSTGQNVKRSLLAYDH